MLSTSDLERHDTDILIIGSGGAGLFAALHAQQSAPPGTRITIAVKGLIGKCGCTRMVQGGYNVALGPGDSVERHFMDTIKGGKWLPNQDMAWRLCEQAIVRVRELENEVGCFFDRNAGRHAAPQGLRRADRFDRTVHKGDLTGIEIINRLMEQVLARPVQRLQEHRAMGLITDQGRGGALRRPLHRHARGRLPLRARQGGAAGLGRRAHHVPLPHPVRRQGHGRAGHGAARRLALARYGDGAIPSHRSAGGRRHEDERHGAGGGAARRRRPPAERPGPSASCSTTIRSASAPRAMW